MQCNHHRNFWENQDREIPNELYAGQINFIKGERREMKEETGKRGHYYDRRD